MAPEAFNTFVRGRPISPQFPHFFKRSDGRAFSQTSLVIHFLQLTGGPS